MQAADLIALRKRIGLTQEAMGERIGLSLRAYQDIENGRSELRRIHINAAERAALRCAIEAGDPMIAPASIRKEALTLARLVTGD